MSEIMLDTQCSDLEFLDDEFTIENVQKIKNKVKKRKWREIENIKENRRLKKALMEFEFAHY